MSRVKVFPLQFANSALCGVIVALLADPCGAAPATKPVFSSIYTSIAAKQCRHTSLLKIDGADYASDHMCPGLGGLKVLRQEDDLRQTVSVGRSRAEAAGEPAAAQGFGQFNSTADTIEWRLADGRPFAIIQRWYVADAEAPEKNGRPQSKQILIVTRLPPGPVCHVAEIEVKGNPNANQAARKAADETARDYQCGKTDDGKR
jgi:hypothetical protein